MSALHQPWKSRIATAARLIVALIALWPIAWAVRASFQSVAFLFHPDLSTARWNNYAEVFDRVPFARFVFNSLLLTCSTTIGTVFTSSLTAFAFARLDWRGKRLAIAALLATWFIPLGVLLIPQFLIFQSIGWVNTYKPLIVPAWLGGSAFHILLFRQSFKSIPRSYEDAARLDGATDWQIYRHIMLPMARPAVGASIALAAIAHWHEFLAPLMYLSDYRAYPVSIGLRMFQMMEGSRGNLIMAASIVSMIPPLLIVLFTQRALMRSISER